MSRIALCDRRKDLDVHTSKCLQCGIKNSCYVSSDNEPTPDIIGLEGGCLDSCYNKELAGYVAGIIIIIILLIIIGIPAHFIC